MASAMIATSVLRLGHADRRDIVKETGGTNLMSSTPLLWPGLPPTRRPTARSRSKLVVGQQESVRAGPDHDIVGDSGRRVDDVPGR
jgi:hypothetical protein